MTKLFTNTLKKLEIYTIMIFNVFLLNVILLISLTEITSAQNISLVGQELQRGKSQLIPVFGDLKTLNVLNSDEIKIKFSFDPRLLHFDSIKTSNNTYLSEIAKFNVVYTTLPELSELECSFKGKNENYNLSLVNDTLFYLSVEALVGSDSLAVLSPLSLNINNTTVENVELNPATYKIGFPIFDILKETVGNFYPNPFGSYTEIKVKLVKDSRITLAIYSINGKLISEFPNSENNVKYLLSNSNNDIINYKEELILKEDEYKISIDPDPFIVSSGAYIVYIKINDNLHQLNFIYQK